MKIYNITPPTFRTKIKNNFSSVNTNSTSPLNLISNETTQKVYANNLASFGVNFKGKPDEEKTLEDLNNEYNWYVNCDHTRPLDAFLKIKTGHEQMNALFCDILKDKDRNYQLIDDIAGRAREGNANYKTLKSLLGESSQNLYFFLPQNPYIKAFEAYMDKRYKDAKSIDELIKLRPDWKESALIEKYQQLTGNTNLKIGKMPEVFQDGTFEKIYDYLKQHMQTSNYKKREDIKSLTIGDKTFNFEYFTEGKTDKNVFGVYVDDKKYVIKMAEESKKSLNAPFSLGVLALIDGYLTMNNCRNIAHLYYYDHDRNASIYQYQEHNTVHQKLNNPIEINHFMPDFKALGMSYNDTIGSDNYFLSDRDCKEEEKNFYRRYAQEKELISVDNDHVTYYQPFMLLLSNYNITLPNAMQHAF